VRLYDFFDSPGPREAKGGIRAHSKRGAFGESWWARRWMLVLEGFGIGGRLGRGRSYARRGQVLDIAIERGRVTARVQGSRPEAYQVLLEVETIPPAGWQQLTAMLGRQARFVARLLAGQMPEDIETVFQETSLTLFPARGRDLRTQCSCPDWSNPCKHVAAVYYLLGEEFDRDPFLIFRLRGIEREDLLRRLAPVARPRRAARGAAEAIERPIDTGAPSTRDGSRPAGVSHRLPLDPHVFWARADAPGDLFGEVSLPPDPAAQLKRLGRFPFWRGSEPLVQALLPLYSRAGQRGLEVFTGVGTGAGETGP
jgi:uncharacterized Zn finger protein